MKLPRSHRENMALRDLAMEDLMAQSDSQLRQEAAEDGENVDALATAVRTELRRAAASILRQRLNVAKERMKNTAHSVKSTKYPDFETLKRRIQSAFELQPDLGLAFREGKNQSEADWQSLYDDLVELGAIGPNEDSR
jgi:aminopeptidase N